MLSMRFEDLFATILRYPDRLAIVTRDAQLTYGQLGARVAAIHAALIGTGVGPVLVHGHKEGDVIPAMVAATCAGRGFVFADTSYPLARIAQIVATCGCGVVLRTDMAAPDVPLPTIVTEDLADAVLGNLALDAASEGRLFYITFTSGSTGEPKGIPIKRRAFAAFMDWFEPLNTGSYGGQHAHVSHASMAFDMSQSDLWTALFAGRTLYLLHHANNLNPRANLAQMQSAAGAPVGTMTATPAFFALMLEDAQFNGDIFPDLRSFWIGGESVPKPLLRRLLDRFAGAEIHHAYGPSEVTCITHSQKLCMADLVAEAPLPLGPQQMRMRVMVDGGDGVLSTSGEGEILLVGPQVADGYLPASHPGNASFGWHNGLRSYRTGDFGRVDDDGGLTIRGRIDGQVKVNGFRVELGEIERNAIQVEGVKMAIAVQASEGAATRGLILVLQGQNLGEATIADVRNHLRQKLPAFMIPAKIVAGDDLPMSLAGKIDRRAVRERFGMV